MAVVGNTLSQIGDILYINSQLAIIGNIQLSSYTEDVEGVTADRFFIKSFKFSLDGLNYSDWFSLTNENLELINGETLSLLFIQFRYERGGTDNTGLLTFNDIQLQGNVIIQTINQEFTIESIFDGLSYNNALTAATSNNLLKKIYKSGILPNYIERGEGLDDKDFISFWSAVSFFLAMVSSFANELDNILYRRKYLIEHVKSLGLEFSDDGLIEELQYLSKNNFDEIRKRGTKFISLLKNSKLSDDSTVPIDGEILRLINKKDSDEFLFELVKNTDNGYFLDKSSFLYNGNYKSMMINKSEENTEDFVDLSLYEIENEDNVSIEVDGDLNCANLSGLTGGEVGFGFNKDNPPNIVDKIDLITIDKNIDYEITFMVKRKVGSTGTLIFGVHGFNKEGVFKPLSFQRITNLTSNNIFFTDTTNKITKIEDQWYQVRGIIYSQRSSAVTGKYSKTNLIGNNLRFNHDEQVNKIKPFIKLSAADGNEFLIHDFKIRPLIRGKNILNRNDGVKSNIINPQFIHGSNTIISHIKNNGDKSELEVEDFIENFLIPYSSKFCRIRL